MFWEIFKKLCLSVGKSPNAVAKELDISSGSITQWKKGRVPHNSTLLKIANHFNVSIEYLLGWPEKAQQKNSSPATEVTSEEISNETIRHYTEPIERQGKNIGIVPIKRTPLNNDLDELAQTMLELFCKLSTIDKCNVISYIEKLNQK